MNRKHIYAISKSESQTNLILNRLFGEGSSTCDICILPRHRSPDRQPAPPRETNVPESAMAGAVIGALAGAATVLLAHHGAFTVPGVVPMVAAGSGLGALAAWVASSSVWKIAGRVIWYRASALESKCLERVPEGDFLISIRATNPIEHSRVKKILSEGGAEEIIAWT